MSHALRNRLEELRRRLRLAGVVRGMSLVIVALLAGLVIAGVVDAIWRSDSIAIRVMLTIAAFAPAVWAALAFLIPPWRNVEPDVDLARRIERLDPSWNGRLSAATAFAHGETAGESEQLQRYIIEDVDRRLESQPLPDLVDPVRVREPILWVGGGLVATLVLVSLSPSMAKVALSRLVMPLAVIEWPRSVELELLNELGDPLGSRIQIGRGQTLRFKVRNRSGDVPDDLTLEVLLPDGRRRAEAVPIAEEPAATAATRTVGAGSLFATEGPLRFRVVGGDDWTMPYVVAEVVPPPNFERIEVVVTPPDYLDQEPTALPPGVGAVTGIVGSSVTVTARANKPIAEATLHIGDQPGPEAELRDDGLTVVATFVLTEPGVSSYWFRLQDRGGFENPDAPRYELRAIADAAPEVTIVDPAGDQQVTADVELPIVVEARDDHALTAVRLRYGLGSLPASESADAGDGSQVISLFEGPERPTQGSYSLLWSLGPLGLVPGDRIVFRAEAVDAYDLGAPNVGTSSPRSLAVVSAVEKREEILDRQARFLEELSQARRDEERLQSAVESVLSQIDRDGELRPADRDLLARAELEQRRLAAKLIDPKDGVERSAARAALDMRANHIDDRDLSSRLERIVRELSALREDALPAADRALTTARKAESLETTRSALTAARSEMKSVVSGLDSLLDDLGAWQNRRELGGEVSDLLSTQRQLTEETARAAAETLGTASGQLTSEQSRSLEQLGLRQSGLSDRLTRLNDAVERLATGAREGKILDSPGDAGLADAAQRLREAALPAVARAAGESIRANDLGEAGRLQRELLARLRELRESLNRSEQSTPDAAALQGAVQRIGDLVSEQEDVLETLRKALDSSDGISPNQRNELHQEQSRLREATAAAARQLRATGAHVAADALTVAGQQMSEGLERLQRQDDTAATQALDEALRELQRGQREAQRAAERLGERLARELVASSLGTISALAERQGGVNREVARLETLRNERGQLSRSQLLTLRKTAETQAAVISETTRLAEKLAPAAAVALALRTAAVRMQEMEAALGRRETDKAAQRHGIAAKQRLDQITAALTPQTAEPSSADEPSASEPADEGAPGETVPLLAQLELVRAMLIDLHQRTQELDAARAAGAFAEPQQTELQRLGEEQAELANLFRRLVDQLAQEGRR